MGAWGTGISSNDTYADVYGGFLELFNSGKEVAEITSELTKQFAETVAHPHENHDFWFAVAKAQWECKQLDAVVLDRVTRIIESGENIRVWQDLHASEADVRKRRAVLEKFLSLLRSERGNPRKRKKKIIREPVFEKGECLTFRLSNGNYGGAVVLEAIKGAEHNYNLIAITRINQAEKPTAEDFLRAEVLVVDFGNWSDDLGLMWYLPVRHKKVKDLIESIGAIPVDLDYPLQGSKLGHMADFDSWVIERANRQFESETVRQSRPKKILLKKFTRRSRWKFWS